LKTKFISVSLWPTTKTVFIFLKAGWAGSKREGERA